MSVCCVLSCVCCLCEDVRVSCVTDNSRQSDGGESVAVASIRVPEEVSLRPGHLLPSPHLFHIIHLFCSTYPPCVNVCVVCVCVLREGNGCVVCAVRVCVVLTFTQTLGLYLTINVFNLGFAGAPLTMATGNALVPLLLLIQAYIWHPTAMHQTWKGWYGLTHTHTHT